MTMVATHTLSAEPDAISPGGGAEIRHILSSPLGDLTHAVCPAGQVAPTHLLPALDEAYYVLAGEGEIWRSTDRRTGVTALVPGRWVQMPAGTKFQYRASRDASLVFLVVVLPTWRPELFHTVDEAIWPPGDDVMPPTPREDMIDDWLSGDLHVLPDDTAPDGSEIRLLGSFEKGSLAHCALHAGCRSVPTKHRTVHEIWYTIEGHGELWRSPPDDDPSVVRLSPGVGVDIPVGTEFQFQATGTGPLRIILLTMPRWPGRSEAMEVSDGRWITSFAR
jgi:mannose-6-phosphate isomerase-like protein (cupin superfamily)